MKEIHFYEYTNPCNVTASWNDTEKAIDERRDLICTLQMGLLSSSLFTYGYRIFIHESPESVYEIKLGDENERTNREIRLAHNLFKMWKAGEFDKIK